MRLSHLIYLLVMSSFWTSVAAYGSGAPESTCRKLMPEHGSDPLTTPSPYVVTPVEAHVEADSPVTISIGSADSSKKFKGFLLQAVDATDSDEMPIGTFVDKTRNSRLISCKNRNGDGIGSDNTLTHRDAWRKQTLTVTWQPPAGFRGQVQFRCTFVESFEKYWVKVPAAQVVHVGPVPVATTEAPDATGATNASCPFRPLDFLVYLIGYCLAVFA